MTRKERKPLEDALASEFVYGNAKPQEVEVKVEELPIVEPKPTPPQKQTTQKTPTQKGSLISRLLESAVEKEATIRLTVDMPESMHRKLSILCARTGKKKADIVRMLLTDALQDVDD